MSARRLVCTDIEAAAISLRDALCAGGFQYPVVIHGQSSFERSGAAELIRLAFGSRDYALVPCAPGFPEASRLRELLASAPPSDLLLAIGGGSVMDTAKILALFGDEPPRSLDAWLSGAPTPPERHTTLWAVPTTSGSGSEVTPFAAIFNAGRKRSLDNPGLRPDLSFSVPPLLKSQPAAVVRHAALDALTQAVESYWNVRATRRSRAWASVAIRTLLSELDELASGRVPDFARLGDGAWRAGEAIAITRTTACHAVSYPLTGRFGIPHGHAVALLLAPMMRFVDACDDLSLQAGLSLDSVRATNAELASLFGTRRLSDAARRVEHLLNALEVERRLSQLGCVTDADRRLVLEEGFAPERVLYLPRVLTRATLDQVLSELG